MFHTKFMIFTGGKFYFFHFVNSRKYNIQGIERLMFISMYISLGVQLYHNFGYMWNVVWNYKHCLKCAVLWPTYTLKLTCITRLQPNTWINITYKVPFHCA